MVEPPWIRSNDARRESDAIAEYRNMTPAERWLLLMSLLRLSSRLLAANDRAERALEDQEPRSPESLALWKRLMAERRGG